MENILQQLTVIGQQHPTSPLTKFGLWLLQLIDPTITNLAAGFYIGLGLALIVLLTLYTIVADIVADMRLQRYVRQLVHSKIAITPDDFLELRQQNELPEFTGVYVIHNTNEDKYYVGQSIHVIKRVHQHLTGHGNGDVYADFVYGRQFELFLVPLAHSGFESLNALEKSTIKVFHAYDKGYNKTRGNKD